MIICKQTRKVYSKYFVEKQRYLKYIFFINYLIWAFTKSLTDRPVNFLKFFEKVNRELNKHFSPKEATV